MLQFRLVIFDFDGTLADSGAWFQRIVSDLADEMGFKRLDECDGNELRKLHAMDVLRHLGVPIWKVPKLMRRVRELAARDADQIRLFPGVNQMLKRLDEAGCALGIVSSNSEENIRRILGANNADRIDGYRCGASLLGKPSRLKKLLRDLEIDAREAIYIGDEIRDFTAAREAGLASAGVAWGYSDVETLRSARPDVFFGRIEEIGERINA